jgi:nucleotide-binding universal stress UspA family protein
MNDQEAVVNVIDTFVGDGPLEAPRPRAGDWTLHPPRVLLAAYGVGRPTPALLRAASVARSLGAELHVLRLIPVGGRWGASLGRGGTFDAMARAQGAIRLYRETRAWCADALPHPIEDECLHVRVGELVEGTLSVATDLDADLVVLPPAEGRSGIRVTSIVEKADIPVLVARAHTAHDTVVAASDLDDPRFTVLRSAATLGRHLASHLVAVHNVPPVVVPATVRIPESGVYLAAEPADLGAREARLRCAACELDPEAEAVVCQEPSTAEAILAAARERDADLVVVGTRPHSWFDRVVTGTVAVRVVDRAVQSVLVMPIHAAGVA